jgi:hypothetical protein
MPWEHPDGEGKKPVFGQNRVLVKPGFWSKPVFGQQRFLVKNSFGSKPFFTGFWSKPVLPVFAQNWFWVKTCSLILAYSHPP